MDAGRVGFAPCWRMSLALVSLPVRIPSRPPWPSCQLNVCRTTYATQPLVRNATTRPLSSHYATQPRSQLAPQASHLLIGFADIALPSHLCEPSGVHLSTCNVDNRRRSTLCFSPSFTHRLLWRTPSRCSLFVLRLRSSDMSTASGAYRGSPPGGSRCGPEGHVASPVAVRVAGASTIISEFIHSPVDWGCGGAGSWPFHPLPRDTCKLRSENRTLSCVLPGKCQNWGDIAQTGGRCGPKE